MPLVLLSFPFFPFVGVPCKKEIQEHRSNLIFLTSNNFLGNKSKTKMCAFDAPTPCYMLHDTTVSDNQL